MIRGHASDRDIEEIARIVTHPTNEECLLEEVHQGVVWVFPVKPAEHAFEAVRSRHEVNEQRVRACKTDTDGVCARNEQASDARRDTPIQMSGVFTRLPNPPTISTIQ